MVHRDLPFLQFSAYKTAHKAVAVHRNSQNRKNRCTKSPEMAWRYIGIRKTWKIDVLYAQFLTYKYIGFLAFDDFRCTKSCELSYFVFGSIPLRWSFWKGIGRILVRHRLSGGPTGRFLFFFNCRLVLLSHITCKTGE